MADLLEKEKKSTPAKTILKYKKILVVVGVIALLYGLFIITGQKNKLPKAEKKPQPLSLGVGLVEDDLYDKFDKFVEQEEEAKDTLSSEIKRQRESQENLKKWMEDKLKELNSVSKSSPMTAQEIDQSNSVEQKGVGYPEPPQSQINSNVQVNSSVQPEQQSAYNPDSEIEFDTWMGGLSSQQFTTVDKKKEKPKPLQFYQPPSFFDAKLLTGIDALTSKSAMAEPEQVFLMITAPAVLPNDIKSNLKGCFVVANASGNLAKERVQLQVVNLSCVSGDGKAVIDQEVLGFVSDKDGKRDLAGNVVSKSATSMAWLMAASAVEAVGGAVNLSAVDQSQSALGTVNVIDTDKLGERAFGNTLKETSKDYKDIIVDYVRQAAPVVEVGAMKDATVFLQQGVWLKIINRFEGE